MEAFEIRRKAAARKRYRVFAVLGALLIGSLITTALMAGASTPVRAGLPEELNALAGTVTDKDDAKHLEKAAEAIAKGLDENEVEKTLKQDAKAVKELMKVEGVDVAAFVDVLIDHARAEAEAAITKATGADTSKAQEKYDRGLVKLDDGDFEKAIQNFAKAVKYAAKAVEKAAENPAPAAFDFSGFHGDIPPVEGSFSVYDVTFVRADTVDSPNPVFLQVSGHNAPGTPGETGASNEGLIFSDEFGIGDTFLGQAGVMQLHVSCSDAFPGGIGAKSDPQPESQWLINTIQIAKVKDGEIDKECNVIGQGLPEPPPEPEVPIEYEV